MNRHIVRDYLQRKSRFFLACSALYLFVCLLIYSALGHTNPRELLMIWGIVFALPGCVAYTLEQYYGLDRTLGTLPLGGAVLARTRWVLGVGIPLAWVCGLTGIASLAAAWTGRFSWLSVILTCTAVFAVASLHYCIESIRNAARPLVRNAALVFLGAMWLALTAMASFGVGYFQVRNPPVDGPEPELVFWTLAAGIALSAVGFRCHYASLGKVRENKARKRNKPRFRRRHTPTLMGNLSGLTYLTVSSLAYSLAVATVGVLIVFSPLGLRQFLGVDVDPFPSLDLGRGPLSSTFWLHALLLFYGYLLVSYRFFKLRSMRALPLPSWQLGTWVTLLPVAILLVQTALLVGGIFVIDSQAALRVFPVLLGAVGLVSVISPAWLLTLHKPYVGALSGVVISVAIMLWLSLASRIAVLHLVSPLVFMGSVALSCILSTRIISRSLWVDSKPALPN